MRLWIYSLFMAWGTFLAIPCPFRKWDEAARGRMLVSLSIVGAVVGALWALVLYLAKLVSCPTPLFALIMASFPWLITGFIHLDGFMDVCDAALSRLDLETRQRILKDPHCGAFGVICLCLLILASFSLFMSAPDAIDPLSLALIPVASRASTGIALLLMKRMDGSQYASTERKRASLLIPLFVILAAAVAVPIVLKGTGGLAPAAASAAYFLFCLWASKQLGGVSGDVSGFSITFSELVGVAVLVLVR